MKKIIFISLGILLVLFIVLSLMPQEEQPPVSRESRMPDESVKVTPETDKNPVKLFSSEYETPVPVKGNVNTAGAEDSAFVMPDGEELYVWFTPDVDVPPRKQMIDGVTGIYYYTKSGSEWVGVERVVLSEQGEDTLDGCLFVSEGDVAWFCSARSGNYPPEGLDIWMTDLSGSEASNWHNAGEKLNKEYAIGELHITSDGQEMYYHKSDGDIYKLEKIDGEWSDEEKLENVNSDAFDGYPFINQEMDELWFTRTYQGTPAIFRSKKSDGVWQEPELIISHFAGEPTLDEEGNLYFTHHFYEEGEMIESDIYVAYKK